MEDFLRDGTADTPVKGNHCSRHHAKTSLFCGCSPHAVTHCPCPASALLLGCRGEVSYEEFLVSLGLAHSVCAQVAFHTFDCKFQNRFDLRQVQAGPQPQLPAEGLVRRMPPRASTQV